MIIKRNERKRARRIIIILFVTGNLHPRLSRISASICLSSFSRSSPSPLFLSSFYSLALFLASTEPAAPLLAPTNGGSFCFTFILISDDPRDQSDAIFRRENFRYVQIYLEWLVRLWGILFSHSLNLDKIKLIKTIWFIYLISLF